MLAWTSIGVLAAAMGFDARWGELPAKFHPVVGIGRLIAWPRSHAPRQGWPALLAGAGLALSVPAFVLATYFSIVTLLLSWPWLLGAFQALVVTSCFSLRLLTEEGAALAELLEAGDLSRARQRLRHLCSRDACELSASEVSAATVESIAENTSDSIVGPFFYFLLLGPAGALLFRTVNTLDSMVGYHGEYERLGKASARLDDLLCWLPARLTALLFLAVSSLRPGTARRGWKVLHTDARRTQSPNAGFPMAAMAGLLGVQLIKRDAYVLGAPAAAPDASTIRSALQVSRRASWLAWLLCLLLVAMDGPLCCPLRP